MQKRKIILIALSLIVVITLFLSISALLQFLTAKNTEENSAYANGAVTNLTLSRPDYHSAPTKFGGQVTSVTYDRGYYVSYTFIPQNSTKIYGKNFYGINANEYNGLRVNGPIKIFYNAGKPDLNSPLTNSATSSQSSSAQLETLTIIFASIFVLSLVAFMAVKHNKH